MHAVDSGTGAKRGTSCPLQLKVRRRSIATEDLRILDTEQNRKSLGKGSTAYIGCLKTEEKEITTLVVNDRTRRVHPIVAVRVLRIFIITKGQKVCAEDPLHCPHYYDSSTPLSRVSVLAATGPLCPAPFLSSLFLWLVCVEDPLSYCRSMPESVVNYGQLALIMVMIRIMD
ncbi:hypothetical protein ASPZODRAFT_1344981 [Penicilliopsis zonata CBS 506.65]|uniref:Uncharacterized protein n=1 Tax=Penicilliopsis zonata CBS 506.65 TaxID=1073090 RepID=A0A1L9SP55_9EURO|nr:hypothetical protein ASPZODRAFT_1344981 [Penicilliopsis zonata CBS 506.65]OJJ48906.1 hypothetical protein ASPZODRAFT_1344981 [Penicilliopsis zonata CBS 506.65]